LARPLKLGLIVLLGEFVRTGLLVTLLPALATGRWHIGLEAAAWAISVHYLVDTLGRTPAGWLVDRYGTRRVLSVGMALAFAPLLLLFFLGGHHVPLFLLTGLYGVGTAPLWPATVTEATGDRRQSAGHVMGYVFAAWLVGAGLGPILTNLAVHASFAWGFLLLILGQGFVLFWAPAMTGITRRLTRPREPWQALWQALWHVRPLLPGMFAQTLTLGLFLPILNLFAQHVLHLGPISYAELLFGAGGVAVVLMVPLGRMADLVGVKTPLAVGFALAAVAVLLLGDARSFSTALAFGAMAGLAYALILPAWNSLLASVAPGGAEGSLWGVFMSVEGLGLSFGPVLGAHAWEMFGVRGPFEAAGVVLTVMALFYLSYPLQNLRRPPIGAAD
jgi:MFS family permease